MRRTRKRIAYGNLSLSLSRNESGRTHLQQFEETLGEMDEEQIVVADQTYSEKFVLIAEDRVKKAGFPLAPLLNIALDPRYQGPAKDWLQPAI